MFETEKIVHPQPLNWIGFTLLNIFKIFFFVVGNTLVLFTMLIYRYLFG